MFKKIIVFAALLLTTTWLASLVYVHTSGHEYAEISELQKQAAKDYLQGKMTATPSSWRWETFSVNPGVELRTGSIKSDNSKGTVIVVPGFTGSIEMTMREIAQIHKAGFTVAAIEYRGQGLSYRPLDNPEKGYVEDYSILADEIAQFANAKREKDKPLFFYSISKGAHITMRMALESDVGVNAYALMVPMIKINTGELEYGSVRRLAKVLNFVGLGSMYAPGQGGYSPEEYGVATPCNGNPQTAQSQGAMFALNEKLRTRGSTIKWLHETFESTEKLLNSDITQKVLAPVKIFTAGVDHLVDSTAASQFCSNLSNCEETHIAEARHCITRENFDVYDSLVDQAITHFNSTL